MPEKAYEIKPGRYSPKGRNFAVETPCRFLYCLAYMSKKSKEIAIRNSAAEYLTFVRGSYPEIPDNYK